MNSKHYTIQHGKGAGATFLCACCDYRVNTKDFDRTNGNARTQAAAAMNRHHDSEHGVSLHFTATLNQLGMERIWRRW